MAEYWFRKRRGLMSGDLGWGWIPISTEGWLITLGFVWTLYWILTPPEVKWGKAFMILLIFVFVADQKTQDKVIFK